MAKSVRASVSKRNRANLRKNVFGPLNDARTERLSAKLQELASQPRPEKEEMDVESTEAGMLAIVATSGCFSFANPSLTFWSGTEQNDSGVKAAAAGEGTLALCPYTK